MAKKSPEGKAPRPVALSHRVTPKLDAALKKAAAAEQRSVSQLVQMRLEAAMKAEGYLK